jgi:hypothetical protein
MNARPRTTANRSRSVNLVFTSLRNQLDKKRNVIYLEVNAVLKIKKSPPQSRSSVKGNVPKGVSNQS